MKTGWCLDGHCPGCRFPNECACLCHPETNEDLSEACETMVETEKRAEKVWQHRPGPRPDSTKRKGA